MNASLRTRLSRLGAPHRLTDFRLIEIILYNAICEIIGNFSTFSCEEVAQMNGSSEFGSDTTPLTCAGLHDLHILRRKIISTKRPAYSRVEGSQLDF